MKSSFESLKLRLFTLTVLGLSSPALFADPLYYDTGTGSGLTGGAGTWDAGTTSVWATNASPGTDAPGLWTDGSDAFFQTGVANTVTISGTVLANSLTQTTNGTVTTVSGGTLQLGAGGLANTGGNQNLTINSAVVLGASQTWNANNNTVTVGGIISDGGNAFGLTKTGAGTLTLNGANTYTGDTVVSAGTLNIGTTALNASIAGNLVNNSATAVTWTNQVGNQVYNGVISGSGGFSKSGTATLTLGGANTFRGTTTLNGGTVVMNNASALGFGKNSLTMTGTAALDVNGNNLSVNVLAGAAGNMIQNNATGTNVLLTVGASSSAGTYAGVIANGTGTVAVAKVGAGAQVFSGANTYTGGTTVHLGTLTVSAGALGNGAVTVNNGATLAATAAVSGSPFGTGAVTSRGGTINFAPTGTGSAIAYGVANGATNTQFTFGGTTNVNLNKGTQTSVTVTVGNAGATGSVLARDGNGMLVINSTGTDTLGSTALGNSEILKVTGTAPAVTNGIVSPYYVGTSISNGSVGNLTSLTTSAVVSSTSASLPTGLVASSTAQGMGSSLLGQKVLSITGGPGAWTITLSGNANAALTDASAAFTGNMAFGNFLSYDNTNGFVNASGYTDHASSFTGTSTEVARVTATGVTMSGSAYALLVNPISGSLALNGTVNIGDNTDGHQAGVILNGTNQNHTFLSGGTLNFGASEGVISLFANTGGNHGLNSILAGSGGVTFGGNAGSVSLNTSNTFSGGITFNKGVQNIINGDGAYGALSNTITLNGGGFYAVNPATLGSTRSLILGSAGGVFNSLNNAITYGGNISGVGSLYTTGSYTRLSGLNTSTGGVTLTQGTLVVSSDANLGTASSPIVFQGNGSNNNVTLAISGTEMTGFGSHTMNFLNGFTLDLQDVNNTFTISQAMNQTISTGNYSSFTKTGAGTVVLTGANVYSNGSSIATAVNGGILRVDASQGGSLLAGGNISLGGGTFELRGKTTGTTSQTLGNVTLNALGGTIRVDGNGGSGTTLNLGTLASGTTAGSSLNVATSGTALVTTISNQDGTGIYGGRITYNGADWASATDNSDGTYTLGAYGGYVDYNGFNSATDNMRVIDGVAIAGDTTVNSVKFTTTTSGQSFDVGSGQTLILSSGGLLFSGANNYSIDNGTIRSATATNSDLLVHVDGAAGGALTINSVIANGTGTSTLTKAGTGTLVLGAAANTYTGATYISGGTLSISNNAQLGATANSTVSLGGTLQTTSTFSTSHVFALGGGGGTFEVTGANVLTAAGVVSGGGVLNKTGSGILELNASNTFTGGINVSSGIVRAGSTGALGRISGVNTLTLSGNGSLQINGNNLGIADLSGTSGTFVENSRVAAGSNTLTVFSGANTTFAGTLRDNDGTRQGNLGLVKGGGANLTLTGANTYTGTTVIQNGTLLINGTHTGAGAYSVTGASGNTNGVLGGTGSITTAGNAGITLGIGAKLAPGASAGTLTATLGTGVMDVSAAVAAVNSDALVFELGAIGSGTSDQFALNSGVLNIGSGVLEFDDFDFTILGGFGSGTYVLFSLNDLNSSITGSLGSALSGTLGGYSGTLAISGNDLILNVAAIPEPSTYALLGGGLALLAFLRRRKKAV